MSEDRKKDHINLTFESRTSIDGKLNDFYYEPLYSAHPSVEDNTLSKDFLNYQFDLPLWVSSMTGGTELAKTINSNLARACGEFKFGMGLGSCRALLDDDNRFEDFNIKHLMGGMPLFTNFGVAQIETLVDTNSLHRINEVTRALKADGIIIHVNPMQEWMQPEGDRFKRAPLESIQSVLNTSSYPIIVKEVGQGFGPKSLKSLMDLPLAAIEFAGFGGTNFTLLEQTRLSGQRSGKRAHWKDFAYIGHDASEMIDWVNEFYPSLSSKCPEFIVSGGIKSPIQAYQYLDKIVPNATIGMASEFLKYAKDDYEQLREFIVELKDGMLMAKAFLERKM